MTEHPRFAHADRALDELLDAAAAAPDDEPEHRTDFAAVLARAHRIDPSAMPAAPPAIGIEPGASRGVDVDRVLDTLVGAAREQAEIDLAAGSERPPLRLASRSGRSIRVAVAASAVLVAAAAVVLALGGIEIGALAQRTSGPDTKSQSAAQFDPDEALHPVQETGEPDAAPRHRSVRKSGTATDFRPPEPSEPAIPDEPAPLEPPAALEPPAPALPETTTPAHSAPPHRVDAQERSRRLDAKAQRQLAAGDPEAAAATLREIVRHGGSTSLAQLAYGDLFTLAHQRGDARAQRALWRSYLRKFPRGRFADDARAGLCRHAPASERASCWAAYLEDFPRGAYRDQAARSNAEGEGGP